MHRILDTKRREREGFSAPVVGKEVLLCRQPAPPSLHTHSRICVYKQDHYTHHSSSLHLHQLPPLLSICNSCETNTMVALHCLFNVGIHYQATKHSRHEKLINIRGLSFALAMINCSCCCSLATLAGWLVIDPSNCTLFGGSSSKLLTLSRCENFITTQQPEEKV